ncbi:hypothetical protein BDD12DRAFT_458110 [Trichophaea hybrida]|nr:hypothetical protein BDD12DRAFT_458110 [Trichophaea hybrida]
MPKRPYPSPTNLLQTQSAPLPIMIAPTPTTIAPASIILLARADQMHRSTTESSLYIFMTLAPPFLAFVILVLPRQRSSRQRSSRILHTRFFTSHLSCLPQLRFQPFVAHSSSFEFIPRHHHARWKSGFMFSFLPNVTPAV